MSSSSASSSGGETQSKNTFYSLLENSNQFPSGILQWIIFSNNQPKMYVLAAYVLVSFTLFVMACFSPYEWNS